ncbi:serine/threonine-protein kinase [Conexibacter stalactiti]|uniref:non-specific serine/threonine protein kinase n=1 Tax=Conexibacter stalactiti TaxID=1940611 RepID=A0ABU4HJI6_9ACTN|nr:serine/threonine-protein kinase [Conexibacter stalactiti]MDW5592837.1 serine/threonine-protein kinase [Conexibacter stalactiti]MEC5033478.1 serine/threonine-protein kinase [Conexibacter stalactiti]
MRTLSAGRELAPGVRVTAHLHRSRHLDVYAAHCERRACPVVVKTVRPDRVGRDDVVRDLLREGRLLRRLTHPHIARGYEVHRAPRPAIVLETMGGETLAHLLDRRDLPARDVVELGRQLASALAYLHGEGILHLDLKPSNVVADSGRAKLLDLSIAQRPGRIPAGRGTWCNMAPEQAAGDQVTAATDVWGLGTVLWEAATGVNPFDERDQRSERAAPVRSLRPRFPKPLAEAVDACLEPIAADRPPLAELQAALASL